MNVRKELLPRNSTQSELGLCRGTSCFGMVLLLMIAREAIFIYQGKQCFLRSQVRRVEVKWGRAFHHGVSAGLLISSGGFAACKAQHSSADSQRSACPLQLPPSPALWAAAFSPAVEKRILPPNAIIDVLCSILPLTPEQEGSKMCLNIVQHAKDVRQSR